MNNNNIIKLKGRVIDVFSNGQYKVQLENNAQVLAHISGKMRMWRIKILPDDIVEVELSPYDLTRGRIVYRVAENEKRTN